MSYIGRFAPSPTGPLHFGSLVAAVASYLEAKTHNGKWLVRMDDLDKLREIDGAAACILSTLEAFGFEWDSNPMYQNQRHKAYAEALSTLQNKQSAYPCSCTRKEVADSASHLGVEGAIYPQTCLQQPIKKDHPIAWRVKTINQPIRFKDAIQGETEQNLAHDTGDYVLKRADGLFAYQLATVVDDAEQGITHIARGADLLNSTPRQIYLQSLLAFKTPAYMHIPIATNADGQKLSKQTLAPAIQTQDMITQLWHALSFLNQGPVEQLKQADLNGCWEWAKKNWDANRVPKVLKIRVKSF
ncbi:MAG: tRNA glutamyl-Q(34) synthetase GluQRS [Methylophilaceae bacterium]